MATVKKMKKAQTGAGVPKGYVRGEMSEGKLYKKADADKWGKGMSDAMDRQAGLGKYAPKKNAAITNKSAKPKAKSGAKVKPCMNCGGKMYKK
jgi:hypothetical protein